MKVNLKSIYILLVAVALIIWVALKNRTVENEAIVQPYDTIVPTKYFLDYSLDSFVLIKEKIKKNDFFANILLQHDIDYPVILTLAENAKDVFDIRRLNTGKNYYILKSTDSLSKPAYFIYEKNPVEYVVFHLEDSLKVFQKNKEVSIAEKQIGGRIESSLYQTLIDAGGTPELAVFMADAYAWSIDFYHIQKQDWFKVIYEEKMVDSITIGVGSIKAMIFNHRGVDFYAFRYEQDSSSAIFFDETGKSLQKFFLKAPVKYSRISSRYSKKRYHPVQKRYKAHLGTDYAAPHGTPIVSVADGIILEAKRKVYNGKYVKIKHNEIYTTQYLHMSGFAEGIKPGKFVKQGDVIGYVGSTGLATGPHVCFRFWKNGQQVDPYKEKFVQTEPKKVKDMEDYKRLMKDLKKELEQIKIDEPKHHTPADKPV